MKSFCPKLFVRIEMGDGHAKNLVDYPSHPQSVEVEPHDAPTPNEKNAYICRKNELLNDVKYSLTYKANSFLTKKFKLLSHTHNFLIHI